MMRENFGAVWVDLVSDFDFFTDAARLCGCHRCPDLGGNARVGLAKLPFPDGPLHKRYPPSAIAPESS